MIKDIVLRDEISPNYIAKKLTQKLTFISISRLIYLVIFESTFEASMFDLYKTNDLCDLEDLTDAFPKNEPALLLCLRGDFV